MVELFQWIPKDWGYVVWVSPCQRNFVPATHCSRMLFILTLILGRWLDKSEKSSYVSIELFGIQLI